MTTRTPDDPAVQRFISRSKVARIATRSPKGNADVIPLWFLYHEGRIYMSTRTENPAVRDLMVNPRVVLLLDGEGHNGNHVLRLRGQATFHEGQRLSRPLVIQSIRRYYSPGGIWNFIRHWREIPARKRYLQERGGETGVIEIVPESAEFLGPISQG